ncbi:sigma-70 family RNA polymerase sigma factor [Pedobacter sp. MC2016-05]|uniref:RNA polymerase sigma factor n=1 Tax=Pedobacter sp. MC2016-05 TaxID=2994474 RepID=UPI002248155B|nr:sigma-70 family RNA polymerase sigma factor [Pedobacter sp. MC2016-05]MCX2473484.1 sigma-70 family RNA polymerase sigma factor [Pedobacter sp. MC2016-05]
MTEKQENILACWNEIRYRNDAKAFERLFHLTQRRFIRFCTQYGASREEAEEIVSDVFVQCWVNRAALNHINKPEVYLLTLIKNKAINHWKKSAQMRVVNIDDVQGELSSVYRPDLDLEKKELRMKLDVAIDGLPLQTKLAFKLVKEEGLKSAEVAEILNISVRTVHTHVYNAMNRLCKEMHQYRKVSNFQELIIKLASATILFLQFNFR